MTEGLQFFPLRSGPDEPALLLTRLPREGDPVLYIHGATFPAALSVAYRFGGRSWMDDLAACGFDVWALDFAGYGGSDRYPGMSDCADGPPLGRAAVAADQIARAVAHILDQTAKPCLSIIAHSWGTTAAGLYASLHPERVARLCLFGPIAQRDGRTEIGPSPQRWRLVTVAQQRARFIEDVPQEHPHVLIEPDLGMWGQAYLGTDSEAAHRDPPAVKIPYGPVADIADAWSGSLPWRPQDIRAPTLIVRGEWDGVTTDRDAAWLLSRLGHPVRRDAKISKGTHLMHLEHSREGLFQAVREFLKEERP